MTEKLTMISVGKKGSGILQWGEVPVEEMITRFRNHAAALRREAEEIETAANEDFQIDVVRGSVVQRHVKTLQQACGKK